MVNRKVAKTFTKLQISINNNNKLTLALRLLTFQVEKIDLVRGHIQLSGVYNVIGRMLESTSSSHIGACSSISL